jgi:PAS domain S-box-containing protein
MSQIEKIIQTITNETQNIIIIKDYNGKFIFGNKQLANLYGTTPEGLVGKVDADFNPNKEQTDFYLQNIQEIMDKNQTETLLEASTDTTTNTTRYYQSIKKPFLDADGDKNILVVASDITDLENTRQKLQERENMLELALEIIGEGVWDWDLSTNLVKHNQQWCDMFFVDDSKLEHPLDFFASLLHPEDAQNVFQKIQKSIEEKSSFKSQHRIICADGTIKWVEDRGKIVQFDAQNQPIRMLGSVRDITDTVKLKEKEKLLEKQSRLATLGEMIGNIAHQWRQPLSVISTLASTISVYNSMKVLDDKVLEDSMKKIVIQTEYLSNTINDFRNFIKNDRNKQDFSLVEMIHKCLSIADAATSRHYISLILNLQDDEMCNGFESEILQAILNIINNAKDILIEKIPDETKRFIFIETKIIDNTIEIKIKDNAGGIPEHILPKVFEPYFTTKQDIDGTGLGLHMCKQIVEDSLGKVTVSNQEFLYNGENFKGAEFVIHFPILSATN